MIHIFTTREIAIFIYAIILLIYVIARSKSRKALKKVIDAACHVKLIIPFLLVVLFAMIFIWQCTFLSFWNWIYIKDIIFWTLFTGVPVCFNSTNRNLEEHYFKNIIIDNLKFTALTEFITGTFTFHILIELILQPILFFCVILQVSAKDESEKTKKVVDNIIGIIGIVIIMLTIKSAVDGIGGIQFVDVLMGLFLPIVLSVLYLPVAYFFALYSKYEIIFLRMSFKEPNNKKLKLHHRIEIIKTCNLSYSKVCKFLKYYVQKMYINMSNNNFYEILDEFRETTHHTYYAIIRYKGKYFISRALTPNSKFTINSFTVNQGGLYKNSNKELRKEIAQQLKSKTGFESTVYNGAKTYTSVHLQKIYLFNKTLSRKIIKIAILRANQFNGEEDMLFMPYDNYIKEYSDNTTLKVMEILKWQSLGLSFFAVLLYFLVFMLSLFSPTITTINLDICTFVFTGINYILLFFQTTLLKKINIVRSATDLINWLKYNGLLELFILIVSIFITKTLYPTRITISIVSKLGVAFLLLDALIKMYTRSQ